MVISTEQSFKLNQAANQKAPGVSKEEGKNHLAISLIPNRRNSLSKNSQNLEINNITMDGPFKRPVQSHPVHNSVPNSVQNLIPNRRSPSNSPNRSNFTTNPKIYPNKHDQTFRSTLWANPEETTTQNFTPNSTQNLTPIMSQNFTSNLSSNFTRWRNQTRTSSFDPFSKSTSGFTSGFEIDYNIENTQRTNVPDNLGWFLKILFTPI